MLAAMVALSFSYFISHQFEKSKVPPAVNLTALAALVNSTDHVLVGAFKKYYQLISSFMTSRRLFLNYTFVLSTPAVIRDLTGEKLPLSPLVAVFDHGKLTGAFGPIDSPGTLIHLIDLYARRARPTVDTLNGSLTGAPYTVVSLPEQFETAFEIARQVGLANVITVSPKVYSELNLTATQCALYRGYDSELVPFECPPADVRVYTKPLLIGATYGSLRRIVKGREHVLAFRSDSSPTEAAELLRELAPDFPDFQFVYFGYNESRFVSDEIQRLFTELATDAVVINFTARYHYNLTAYVPPDLLTGVFNKDAWRVVLNEQLLQVRAGHIPKTYLSEPPAERVDGVLQRLAGINYIESVMNESVNEFVYFVEAGCEECRTAISPLYRQFSDAVQETNETEYEFGTLDFASNFREGGFPVTGTPVILLYPKGDKANIKVLPYESFDVFAWFAAKYASKPHTVRYKIPTEETLVKVEERVQQIKKVIRPDLVPVLEQELQELKADIAKAKEAEQAALKEAAQNVTPSENETVGNDL
jgi:hypothetical protein